MCLPKKNKIKAITFIKEVFFSGSRRAENKLKTGIKGGEGPGREKKKEKENRKGEDGENSHR